MKQQLFRIFDLQLQRYLSKEDNANISIEGTVNVPETHPKPEGDLPQDGRFEVAINTGIPDVTGKDLYSDDHIVMIIDRKAVICHVGFDISSRSWMAYPGTSDDPHYALTDFEIGPNRQEHAEIVASNVTGDTNPGVRIMKEWEEKASLLPPDPPQQGEGGEQSTEDPAAETEVKKTEPVVVQATRVTSQRLMHIPTEVAPQWWRKNPEIAAARPKQNGVQIVLKRLVGTNIAVWYITRNEQSNTASDMFLVTEVPVATAEIETEKKDENTTAE